MANSLSPWRVTLAHAIFATDPAPLWKLVAQFDGLPALVPELVKSGSVSGEGVGMVRTLNLEGGGVVREVLIALHPEQFRLTYAMEDAPENPWDHYFCTLQLQALGAAQTHLLATGYFQPREGRENDAREGLGVAYEAIFAGLARVLSVQVTR